MSFHRRGYNVTSDCNISLLAQQLSSHEQKNYMFNLEQTRHRKSTLLSNDRFTYQTSTVTALLQGADEPSVYSTAHRSISQPTCFGLLSNNKQEEATANKKQPRGAGCLLRDFSSKDTDICWLHLESLGFF